MFLCVSVCATRNFLTQTKNFRQPKSKMSGICDRIHLLLCITFRCPLPFHWFQRHVRSVLKSFLWKETLSRGKIFLSRILFSHQTLQNWPEESCKYSLPSDDRRTVSFAKKTALFSKALALSHQSQEHNADCKSAEEELFWFATQIKCLCDQLRRSMWAG